VIWLPLDLHPEYPAEGIQRAELSARHGDAFHERLKQSFAASGGLQPAPRCRPEHDASAARDRYVSLHNSARLALSKLEDRLRHHSAGDHDFGTAFAVLDAEARRAK
jgi:hypothetical protein